MVFSNSNFVFNMYLEVNNDKLSGIFKDCIINNLFNDDLETPCNIIYKIEFITRTENATAQRNVKI